MRPLRMLRARLMSTMPVPLMAYAADQAVQRHIAEAFEYLKGTDLGKSTTVNRRRNRAFQSAGAHGI